jgi:ribosomal-protein-alanine N-acetyltransferase
MEIVTDRLVLREFATRDWRALHAYQNHPRYLQVGDRNPQTEQQSRKWVEMFMANVDQTPRRKFQLVATLKDTGEVIGNCGVRRNDRTEWDAELGYELSADHWGKGYATEAAGAMLAFGFRELGIHRASAHCNASNAGSIHVLEKLGMRQEGCIRDGDFQKGAWWDLLLWGILESEWRERQR